MIIRQRYLNLLSQLARTNLVKTIVGVRRCGKSVILRQFARKLQENGVPTENIQLYDFEDEANEELQDRKRLMQAIKGRLRRGQNYIFLDEVQRVPEYEILIDALFVKEDVDLYVTGSNAFFLSSELATFLSGRYVTIHVLPLSFAEALSGYDGDRVQSNEVIFSGYLQNGGMPEVSNLRLQAPEQIGLYLTNVFETIVQKDVIQHGKVKDRLAFDNLTRFSLDSIGSILSPNSIANCLKAANQSMDVATVGSYLHHLCESYFLYDCKRFDIKGKRLLKTLGKYYVVDTGFRQVVLGRAQGSDLGHLIENVVYLELLRRYPKVYLGKAGATEVDFCAIDQNGITKYFQVAATVRDEMTLARELRPLMSITDHFQKFLLTLDPEEPVHQGIEQRYLIDWLLEGEARG